ncbi:MAG TPA: NAD(P)/FAD-dependent oxidoreductase [Actinomycetota bacterium]|nr:NAD(P)/FAD-dependent oxidoreductase [Actinomycetota bacterium]
MVDTPYDVAIVGASLAGCATATFLGRAGKRVALLERHTDTQAYKHLCTTFIQASAEPVIQRLGLDAPMAAAGGLRSGTSLWTRWGWIRDTDSPLKGFAIRREKLDPMIRELAASTPGVDFLPGHTLKDVLTDNGRVVGVAAEAADGSRPEIRAHLVVGADGRSSETAAQAGVKTRVIKKHGRSGYFGFYRNVELPYPGEAHIWFMEPDCAYAFPMDDGVTILAMMFTRDKSAAFKKDVQGNLVRFFESIPPEAGPPVRFDPADRVGKVIGLVDYDNLWRHRPPPGLAFVGDAAITGDPLFGIGCGWAMQGAEWLADAVAPHLGTGQGQDKAVEAYCATLRTKLAAHFFLISDYSTGRGYNPMEKLTFAAGARDARGARLVGEIGGRTIPATTLMKPGVVAHAVKVNLTAGKAAKAAAKQNRAALKERASTFSFTPASAVAAEV